MHQHTAEPTKLGTWIGHLMVTAFLGLVLFLTAGCSGSGEGTGAVGVSSRAVKQRVQDRVAATTSDPAAAIVRPASVEQPAMDAAVNPENVSFEDGARAYSERRFPDAAGIFEAYTASKPENPWGYYMLGLSAWKAGQLERAREAFESSLELDTDHVKSLINLGRVLLEQEKPDEALEVLEKAIDIDPTSSAAYRLRGVSLYDLGRVEEAVESYGEALEVDQNDAWSMNNLGLLLIREERFDEAVPPLALAVRIQESPVFFNNLGIALERTGHLKQAADAFDRALSLDDAYGKARVNRDRVEQILAGEELQGDEIDLEERADSFRQSLGGEKTDRAEEIVIPDTMEAEVTDSVTAGKIAIDSVLPRIDSIKSPVKADSGSTGR